MGAATRNHKTGSSGYMGVVALMGMGMVICILGGCASLRNTDWAAVSNMYNGQMNYEYEQMNKYRQGPALRQPAQEVTVQPCPVWPYCPQ